MLRLVISGFVASIFALGSFRALADDSVALPLSASPGGAYEVSLVLDGESERFLLDTGAAMMTINGALFKRLAEHRDVQRVREVAAKLADGRYRRFDVYEIEGVQLAEGCELDTVEVVVVPGKGRNLLGLNALERFAPLTLSMNPPMLGLAGCAVSQDTVVAVTSAATVPEPIAHYP